jgi:hypothetical protein
MATKTKTDRWISVRPQTSSAAIKWKEHRCIA